MNVQCITKAGLGLLRLMVSGMLAKRQRVEGKLFWFIAIILFIEDLWQWLRLWCLLDILKLVPSRLFLTADIFILDTWFLSMIGQKQSEKEAMHMICWNVMHGWKHLLMALPIQQL